MARSNVTRDCCHRAARRMRFSFVALPLLLTLSLLVGCALPWQRSTRTLKPPQVVHMALVGTGASVLPSIDPAFAVPLGFDSPGSDVTSLIFDQLITLDAHLRPKNWATDKVTISADGLTYTFTLRSGQSFSDGTPVHASDYAYAMDRLLNPCLQAPGSYLLWMLKDAQTYSTEDCSTGVIKLNSGQTGPLITTLIGDAIVPDDGAGTLTLRLTRPAAYFLSTLATGGSFAIERSVVTGAILGRDSKWIANLALGTTGRGGGGMFYVAHLDQAAGTMVLKANPHWWGASQGEKPSLEEVDLWVIPSTALLSTSPGAPFDYVEYAAGTGPSGKIPAGLEPHTQPALSTQLVMLNWQVPPFDHLDARRAFCLAINRDALAKDQFGGALIPGWNLVPQGIPGYSPLVWGIDGMSATAGDQALARSYWAAYVASLHGKPIPPLTIPYNYINQDIAGALAQQWNAALPGANVQAQPPPDTVLTENMAKHFQMYTFDWIADYPDPQDFLSLLYATSSSFNDQNASVPQADQWMAQADALVAPDQQAQRDLLYAQAEELLIQQAAACPLGQFQTTYLLSPKVQHFGQTAMGTVPLDDFVNAYVL
ncbi:MAG TPA: ABC transporter substrate-binding protein [Ktedonobacterales bacterium]